MKPLKSPVKKGQLIKYREAQLTKTVFGLAVGLVGCVLVLSFHSTALTAVILAGLVLMTVRCIEMSIWWHNAIIQRDEAAKRHDDLATKARDLEVSSRMVLVMALATHNPYRFWNGRFEVALPEGIVSVNATDEIRQRFTRPDRDAFNAAITRTRADGSRTMHNAIHEGSTIYPLVDRHISHRLLATNLWGGDITGIVSQ